MRGWTGRMVILEFTGRVPLGTVIRSAEREDSEELGRPDFKGLGVPSPYRPGALCFTSVN